MRPLRALVIYIAVVFVGGALLAPWLYWLAQAFAHSFPKIAAEPFNRFVDRSLLILALMGLWPLMRAFRVTSWREIGLVGLQGQRRKFLGGLLLGFLSLAVVAGTAVLCGQRVLVRTETSHEVVAVIFSSIGTAAVVAVLEEILFRGGVFGGLRKFFYWPLALVISSLIYALAHFLRRADFTGPVNLGNPGEFTIRRLAEMVIDMTGSKSKLVAKPLPADDPRQRQPKIALAKRALGWEPRIPLEDGLKLTIAYFDGLLRGTSVEATT